MKPSASVRQLVKEHLDSLDDGLAHLSRYREGRIADLPAWALMHREVSIGVSADGEHVVIRIDPNEEFESDRYDVYDEADGNTLRNLMRPWQAEGKIEDWDSDLFLMIGGSVVGPVGKHLDDPMSRMQHMIAFGATRKVPDYLSRERGLREALQLWGHAWHELGDTMSYVDGVRRVLARMRHLPKRKSFVERRLHRFIRDHARVLLPSHRSVHFEHTLRLGDETRAADFILERDEGFPPLLVELESAHHKVVRKDGGLTAPVTHALRQIEEWVRFIDEDAQVNATGMMSFLSGPKDRLVVIGRGGQASERMLEARHSGVTIWTYDTFLDQARRRLNDAYESQCELLGLVPERPF